MNEKDNHLTQFIIGGVLLVIFSLIYPFIVNYFFHDWSKSGTFGDSYGALNAIFSGIAVAGLVVTILIQRKELENQRSELSLQRIEIQETRKEFLINRVTNI